MTDDEDAENPAGPHVRIHIEFEKHEGEIGGESMHAIRVMDGPVVEGCPTGYYEIDNIPFFATLRLNDVVQCIERDGVIPEIIDIYEPSSRKTVSVVFGDHVGRDDRTAALQTLIGLGVATERAAGPCYVLAMPPRPDEQDKYDLAMALLELAASTKLFIYDVDDRP